jgi:hypothetical protein
MSYLFPYLLTPRSRFLLKKLTGFKLVKKFSTFYGTRRFITALISARHLCLSWASSIQSIPSHPTTWRSILILSSYLGLGLPSGLFSSGFPTKILYILSSLTYVLHAPPISNTRYQVILNVFYTVTIFWNVKQGCCVDRMCQRTKLSVVWLFRSQAMKVSIQT